MLWAESAVYTAYIANADLRSDAVDNLRVRLWQPALHLPDRVALARKRALAHGTATNLLVTAAESGNRTFIPRFSFSHIHPEASLAVSGDGRSVEVCGVVDAVPGLRMIVNSRVVPSTFPSSGSLRDVDAQSLSAELSLTYNGIDGCQISVVAGHQPGAGQVVTISDFANALVLTRQARYWMRMSPLQPSASRLLERFQIEQGISLYRHRSIYLSSWTLGLRYTHPLASVSDDSVVDEDGPVPRLIVEARTDLLPSNISSLQVTYDPVDVLHVAAAAPERRGQDAPTGLCTVGRLSMNHSARSTETVVGLKYYGKGFRVGGHVGRASQPGEAATWMTTVSVMQRFKHSDVAAYATCVADRQVAQTFTRLGVSLNYHF